jgi:hypothetical protein
MQCCSLLASSYRKGFSAWSDQSDTPHKALKAESQRRSLGMRQRNRDSNRPSVRKPRGRRLRQTRSVRIELRIDTESQKDRRSSPGWHLNSYPLCEICEPIGDSVETTVTDGCRYSKSVLTCYTFLHLVGMNLAISYHA